MSVKIPFINTRDVFKADNSFISLIKNAVCPHFQLLSITSLLLGICLFVFILMHILYPPSGYSVFLQLPTQMHTWCLDIQAFINNKAKFYTLITAMFIHYSYRHIVMNLIFAIFIMYELEYCWKWSILVGLAAGFAANCLAVVTMNGLLLGFSGALCGYIGIILAAIIQHCSYLKAMHYNQCYMVTTMIIVMLFFIVGLAPAGIVHLFGVLFGLLFGLALYPVMPECLPNPNVDKLFKIFSVAFLVIALILAFTA